jgi:hypothetical protein
MARWVGALQINADQTVEIVIPVAANPSKPFIATLAVAYRTLFVKRSMGHLK